MPSQHSDHTPSSPPTTVTTSNNTSRSNSRRRDHSSSHSSDESTIPARKRKSRLTSPEWSENKSNRNPFQTTRPEPNDTLGSSGDEIGSKRAKTTSRTSNQASWSSPISYKPQQVEEEEEEGEEGEEEDYSGDSDDQISQPSAPAWIPSQPQLTKVRDAKPYKCVFPGCDKSYPKPSRLAEHERVHTDERPFKCHLPGCSAAFRRESHFATHLKGHVQHMSFKCQQPGCTAAFYTHDKLLRHLRSHSFIVAPSASLARRKSLNAVSSTVISPTTTSGQDDDSDLTSLEQPVDVETLMRIAEEIETAKPYACSWAGCTERFSKHRQLKSHTCVVHMGTKPNPCTHEGCDKSFPTPSKLRKHMMTHSDALRYGCGFEGCNSYFSKWSQLQKHNKDAHKTIPCTHCDKKILKRNMTAHLKTHDDSRPQVHCQHDGCSKVFSTKRTLATHVKLAHTDTEPQELVCDHDGCGMTFLYKHVLQRHVQTIHTNPPKPRKIRSDAIRPSLVDSILGFSQTELERVMPFACPLQGCERRFNSQRLLRRHLKSKAHAQDAIEDVEAVITGVTPILTQEAIENQAIHDLIELNLGYGQ
ncbi:hypothetical protein BGZ59_006657 [Podila verticillata]|nr:hypothetical protein BGZ59_006657 [Podila verticillata]